MTRTSQEARRWTRALRLAERLGVAVVAGHGDPGSYVWKDSRKADYHMGPTGLSWIRWHRETKRRVVIVDANRFEASTLLHEIAHVVVGTRPDVTEEVDGPLLAVEVELARRVGISWREQFDTWDFSDFSERNEVGSAGWRRLLAISRHLVTSKIRTRLRQAYARGSV